MSRLVPPEGGRVMCPCGCRLLFIDEYVRLTGKAPTRHPQPSVTRIGDMTPGQLAVSGIDPAVAASLRGTP